MQCGTLIFLAFSKALRVAVFFTSTYHAEPSAAYVTNPIGLHDNAMLVASGVIARTTARCGETCLRSTFAKCCQTRQEDDASAACKTERCRRTRHQMSSRV